MESRSAWDPVIAHPFEISTCADGAGGSDRLIQRRALVRIVPAVKRYGLFRGVAVNLSPILNVAAVRLQSAARPVYV